MTPLPLLQSPSEVTAHALASREAATEPYLSGRALTPPPVDVPIDHQKAAALLHSLARNHVLVDGNERIALTATIACLDMNGIRLTFSNDEAYDMVISVATGSLADVADIAAALQVGSELWAL